MWDSSTRIELEDTQHQHDRKQHKRWFCKATQALIILDGQSYAIRPKLYEALHHLRHANDTVILWIDALCINQDDLLERSLQVPLMSKIFSQARQVLLWIGGGRLEAATLRLFIDKDARTQFLGVATIENTSWFTRLWTMQEFILAKNPVFCARSARCAWSTIEVALHSGGYRLSTLPLSHQDLAILLSSTWDNFDLGGRLNKLRALRNYVMLNGHLPVDIALNLALNLDTSDVRDLIYGLSGLMKEGDVQQLQIDYRKPAQEVFVHFIRQMFPMQHLWLLLSRCPVNTSSCSDLPDWLPTLWKRIPSNDTASVRMYPQPDRMNEELSGFETVLSDLSTSTNENSTSSPYIDESFHLHSQGFVIGEISHAHLCTFPWGPSFEGQGGLPDPFWFELRRLDKVVSAWSPKGKDLFAQLLQHIKETWKDQLNEWPDQTWTDNLEHTLAIVRASASPPLFSSETPTYDIWGMHRLQRLFAGAQISYIQERHVFCKSAPEVETGDIVASFIGSPVAFAVRKVANDSYRLIGQSWVWGNNGRVDGREIASELSTTELVFI